MSNRNGQRWRIWVTPSTILGVAKVLGVFALLTPGFQLLKEWAYAGFTFDLLGASASHAFVSDPPIETALPLIILGIAAVSYFLRPASRRLPVRRSFEDPAGSAD